MILTCPDCATSYFVDDDRVPPQGRTVKCTSCGNRWRAMPEGAAEPELESPPSMSAPIAEATAADAEPIAPEDDLEFVAAPVTPKRKSSAGKKRPVGLMVGLGLAGVAVAAVGAAVLFRQQLADMAPASAPVFAAVGLKVDTLGLAIEDVTSKAVLQAGRPVLSITGVIRNKNKTSTEAPPIRISLLDKDGKAVAGLIAEPLNAKVPPGARRYFAVALPDPPAGAHELEIAFDLTAKPATGLAPEAAHAPAAVEAKPLPADSPDALAPHEQH